MTHQGAGSGTSMDEQAGKMSETKVSTRIPRIGICHSGDRAWDERDWWNELRRGLGDLGYVEGKNIELIWRFGDGRFERLPQLAKELVEHGVDIIMPATPPAIRAAKEAASTIPVVFPLGSDPVETRLVTSMERSGGNITGMATMSRLQSHPRLALVRECLPTARRVALLRHSANSALNLQVEASRTAASELGFELFVLDFAIAEEIEHAFEIAGRQTTDAILPLSDPMASGNAGQIGDLSLKYRIPVVSPFREITDAGGLLELWTPPSRSCSIGVRSWSTKSSKARTQVISRSAPRLTSNWARTFVPLGLLNISVAASILSRATRIVE